MKLTRQQLYQLVWNQPISRLARSYGLSDVGMAKICKKHSIPRPPRGFWAKKQFGQSPPQTPLPNPQKNAEIDMREPREDGRPDAADEQLELRVAEEARLDRRIQVADNLHGSHELVRSASHELRAAATDDFGIIACPETCALKVSVSKTNLRRALLIMDALLKALVERGFVVATGPTVTISDVEIRFSISESLKTERDEPDEPDLEGRYHFGHSRFNSKRVPSGRLSIGIINTIGYWGSNGIRRTWSDSDKQRLEGRLNRFVAGLITFAARLKQHNAEVKWQQQAEREREERRQAEAERRAEVRTQIKAERARVDALLQQAKNWRQSELLRQFIEASKAHYLAMHGAIEPQSKFEQWLEWAVQQADRLDPLVPSPPSILDEKVEEEESSYGNRRSW
jgi:hypothetical protein